MSFLFSGGLFDVIPDSVEYQFVASSAADGGDWTSEDGSLTLTALGSPTKQSGALNGEDTILYDGVDDGHENTTISIAQPDAIVAVYQSQSTGDDSTRAIGNHAGSNRQFITPESSTGYFGIFAQSAYVNGSTAGDTNWHIHSGYFDAGNSETRVDGATDGTGDPGNGDLDNLHIAYDPIVSVYTDIEVAEFWIMNNPTLSEVAEAESQLNGKYAVF